MKRYYNRGIIKNSYKEITHSPHATTVLKRVGPALQRPPEMAMHLMLPFAALIDKGQLEQRPDIRTFAGERDKDGDVSRVVLWVFSVRVEVYGPLKPTHCEIITCNVLSNSHAFSQRETLDHELVRAVHRLRHGPRASR